MSKVFISYSHQDEKWKDQLAKQLQVLELQGDLESWDDRRIGAGADWFAEITGALNEAEAAVLMISADFLTSGFILEQEVPVLLQRRAKENLKIFPMIVRPCPWCEIPWLKAIQGRPIDGKPLSEYPKPKREKILSAFALEIKNILVRQPKPQAKPQPLSTLTTSPAGAHTGAPLEPVNISISKLPVTGKDLFGREKELELLDKAWLDPHTHMVTFVAWGGVGKSALVNYWLNLMEKKDYGGAKRVYGWSFYSQGAEAGKQASADEFMQTALGWFGDPDPTVGGAVEKARRLVELIRREPTLLVLDGLEPLQYPPGELHGFDGRLKDQGLKVLLKELAVSQPGLCVITTRETLADTADKQGHTVKEVCLEHLSDEAGAQLLRSLGVTGAEKELFQAVREYDGHALALTLLGNYLHSVYRGDIRKRDQVPGITQDRKMGWQARRMMAAYENWWGEAPEVSILRIMGLFDRPAPDGAIKALTAAPAIPGLTEKLQGLSMEERQWALTNLREAGLVAKTGAHKPGAKTPDTGASSHSIGTIGPIRPISPIDTIETIDSHPLIREHFGAKLKTENPSGWKEAHTRLYKYYKSVPKKELPDTLEEMEPLFAAITHGCAAGLRQEALMEVYWPRISRGEEAYTVHKLGALGANLTALSHFFEVPWSKPASELAEHRKAFLLSCAGYGLWVGGRLIEAILSFEYSLKAYIEIKKWDFAAIDSCSLSQLLLTLGRVEEAVANARQSVFYADKRGYGFHKESKRTALADALHQAGQLNEAEQMFRDAESLQKERQPKYKYLYSQRGFQFCDLLLGLGHYQEAMQRAEAAIKIAYEYGRLLDIALDTLTLGQAWLQKSLEPGNKNRADAFQKANEYLHQAVEGLRKSGYQDDLPRGLLARAEYFRVQKEYKNAWQDLTEAFEIAELGSMRLYIADYHLEAGRLCRAEGKEKEASEHFREAKALIEEMGYFRRKKEL